MFQLDVIAPLSTGIKGNISICNGDKLRFSVADGKNNIFWNHITGSHIQYYLPSEVGYGDKVNSLKTTDGNGCIKDTLILLESNNCGPDFEVFPNPNDGQFNIRTRFAEEDEALVEVFNIIGQQTFMQTIALHSGLNQMNVQFIPEYAGAYILRAHWRHRKDIVKLVVH